MDEERSQIIITFSEEFSALFTHVYVGKITPLQVLMVAEALRFDALEQLAEARKQHVSKDTPDILVPKVTH